MSVKLSDIDRRRFLQSSAALGAGSFGAGLLGAGMFGEGPVFAQSRGDGIIVVQELGPNSLDMHGIGANQSVNGVAWNCYDRLVTYAVKMLPDGTPSYDREKLAPELAESWQEPRTACPAPSSFARMPSSMTASRSPRRT